MVKKTAPRAVVALVVTAGTTIVAQSAAQQPASAVCFASFVIQAQDPYRSGNGVRDKGDLYTSGGCLGSFYTEAQTKVCGSFGCNWHVRGDEVETVTTGLTEMHLSAFQDCRDGTNRYRTKVFYTWSDLGGGHSTDGVYSAKEPEFTC